MGTYAERQNRGWHKTSSLVTDNYIPIKNLLNVLLRPWCCDSDQRTFEQGWYYVLWHPVGSSMLIRTSAVVFIPLDIQTCRYLCRSAYSWMDLNAKQMRRFHWSRLLLAQIGKSLEGNWLVDRCWMISNHQYTWRLSFRNSDSYAQRNISSRFGEHLVPMGNLLLVWMSYLHILHTCLSKHHKTFTYFLQICSEPNERNVTIFMATTIQNCYMDQGLNLTSTFLVVTHGHTLKWFMWIKAQTNS